MGQTRCAEPPPPPVWQALPANALAAKTLLWAFQANLIVLPILRAITVNSPGDPLHVPIGLCNGILRRMAPEAEASRFRPKSVFFAHVRA